MNQAELERIKSHALACKTYVLKGSENTLNATESQLTLHVLVLVDAVEGLRKTCATLTEALAAIRVLARIAHAQSQQK